MISIIITIIVWIIAINIGLALIVIGLSSIYYLGLWIISKLIELFESLIK